MEQFILNEGEEILANFANVYVKANDNEFHLIVFLTNKRIALLKNVSNELLMNQFLQSRMISIPEELETVLIIPFSNIKELKYLNGKNIITFKDNNKKIEIACDDFRSYRISLD